MTSVELKARIAKELKSEKDLTNVFGLNLASCLIEPILQPYQNAVDSSQTETLWTVLEETPDKTGYKIYFDEETNMFGLGIAAGNGQLVNIGCYGTFLETLYSM